MNERSYGGGTIKKRVGSVVSLVVLIVLTTDLPGSRQRGEIETCSDVRFVRRKIIKWCTGITKVVWCRAVGS
jgi:hypothetical protein